jgi:hypothetical protein
MPIDFTEEELPKRELATCRIHNLKYDPQVTWGCVLCKKNQKKRISWTLVAGGILIAFAALFYASQFFSGQDENRYPPIVISKAVAVDTATASLSVLDKLKIQTSEKIEQCLVNAQRENAGHIDKELCLGHLEELKKKYGPDYNLKKVAFSPVYSLGNMPEWHNCIDKIEKAQLDLEKCFDTDSYLFGIRAKINSQTGKTEEVIASTFGISPSQRSCVYNFFNQLIFPAGSADSYIFTTFIDSEFLKLHRPKMKNTEQKAYEEFVKNKRKEIENSERMADLQAQQRARELQYREYIKNSTD